MYVVLAPFEVVRLLMFFESYQFSISPVLSPGAWIKEILGTYYVHRTVFRSILSFRSTDTRRSSGLHGEKF